MPEYGRLAAETLPHALPAISPLYPPPPWPLPGARVLKVLYETDAEPATRWLPPKVSRPVPPYAIVTAAHFPESPVGPFSFATQEIGCRATMFIRALSVQSLTDSPVAMAALRELWGFPCKLGEVSVEVETGKPADLQTRKPADRQTGKPVDRQAGERGRGELSWVAATVSRNGAVLAEMSMGGGAPIDGENVRFDPVLNLRAMPSLEEGKRHDVLQMVQIDPEITIKSALRGKGVVRLPSESEDDPWQALPVRNVISAVYCEIDTELPLARFVMPY